jgi:hypothetical protein
VDLLFVDGIRDTPSPFPSLQACCTAVSNGEFFDIESEERFETLCAVIFDSLTEFFENRRPFVAAIPTPTTTMLPHPKVLFRTFRRINNLKL